MRAANLDSSHADAHVKAGTLLLVAGDYREARALAERALKANPKSADAHILLGNALAGLDNPSRALNQIEQAIHLDPTYAPAWTTLGALQFHGGKREQARQYFQKAVDLDPKSADARVALANYEWATGDTKAAEAAFRATLLMAPQNPDAHRAIALLYLTTKRAKLAEPHFQALATDPRGKLALADYYLGTAQEAAARRVLDELAAGDNKAHSRAARLRLATVEYSMDASPRLIASSTRSSPSIRGVSRHGMPKHGCSSTKAQSKRRLRQRGQRSPSMPDRSRRTTRSD